MFSTPRATGDQLIYCRLARSRPRSSDLCINFCLRISLIRKCLTLLNGLLWTRGTRPPNRTRGSSIRPPIHFVRRQNSSKRFLGTIQTEEDLSSPSVETRSHGSFEHRTPSNKKRFSNRDPDGVDRGPRSAAVRPRSVVDRGQQFRKLLCVDHTKRAI